MEYPPTFGDALLRHHCVTVLHQHRLQHRPERHQLSGRRVHNIVVLYYHRLPRPETPKGRTSTAAAMDSRTLRPSDQYRLPPLPHPGLVLLFLARFHACEGKELELGARHVRRHDHNFGYLLPRQGQTCVYWPGGADEKKSLEPWGAAICQLELFRHLPLIRYIGFGSLQSKNSPSRFLPVSQCERAHTKQLFVVEVLVLVLIMLIQNHSVLPTHSSLQWASLQ